MPGVNLVDTHELRQPRQTATAGHQTLQTRLEPTELEEDRPMPTQRFTLIVEGADLQSEPLIDDLFEAGCGDATFGRSEGVQYVDFDREAASPGAAILSAVRDIEQFEGVHVTGITDVEPAPVTDIRTWRATEGIGPLVAATPRPDGLPQSTTVPGSVHGLGRWSEATRPSRHGSEHREPPTTTVFPQSALVWNDIAAVPGSPLRRVRLRRHRGLG